MKIELKEFTIRDIVNGYENSDEEGVVAFSGRLDIRPKYQREFVYKEAQRNAVIDTIRKGFPLNVMYWVKNDDNYEVLDGQQRTISFCEYVVGNFSVDEMYFHNLTNDKQEQILDYKLFIYICDGTDSEKLEWFKTINIAGEKLSNQELRNAVYTGPWLSSAKQKFSKTGCMAYKIGEKYMSGSPIRQEYLETAISWINNGKIEEYMSIHQQDDNADELWQYFRAVIEWVELKFPKYRKEMKGIAWGELYNKYKDKSLDAKKLEAELEKLMMDDEVTNKKGVYPYVLSHDERHLNLRAFSDSQKRKTYEKQKGICPMCKEHFEIEQMEADHITPWSQGGKTNDENCQMLCKECNRRKSDK